MLLSDSLDPVQPDSQNFVVPSSSPVNQYQTGDVSTVASQPVGVTVIPSVAAATPQPEIVSAIVPEPAAPAAASDPAVPPAPQEAQSVAAPVPAVSQSSTALTPTAAPVSVPSPSPVTTVSQSQAGFKEPIAESPIVPWKAKETTKKNVGPRKIMQIVSVVLAVLLILGIGAWLLLKGPSPENIRITNLTDQSVTVSWTTSSASKGVVLYRTNNDFNPLFLASNGALKAYDDRDVQAARLEHMNGVIASEDGRTDVDLASVDTVEVTDKGKYYVHHVTLENLEPSTQYYFQVGNGMFFTSGGTDFATDATISSTNTFKTYPLFEELLTPNPTYGSIVNGSEKVVDGMVFMVPKPGSGSGPLSTVLNEEGRWYIDLSNTRSDKGEAVKTFGESEDKEVLSVEAGRAGRVDSVTILMSEDAPARTIDIETGEARGDESDGGEVGQEVKSGIQVDGDIIESPSEPTPIPVQATSGASTEILRNGDKFQGRIDFVGQVYAADLTYTISDEYVIIPDSTGVYDIVIPGEGIAEDVLLLDGLEYIFYFDTNGNGVWDEGEEQITVEGLTVDLTLNDSVEAVEIDLVKGLNFVSFEHLPEAVDSCELIEELDTESERGITQLARFESGAFEAVSFRRDLADPPAGDCFPVVPGRGYVIKSNGTGKSGFSGYRLKKPAGVLFDTAGWHLIGVNGGGRTYTASSLIDSIDKVEGLDADNVTKWISKASKYDGLQKEADDAGQMMTFGFDYIIEPGVGYFVRIAEAGAVWTPD